MSADQIAKTRAWRARQAERVWDESMGPCKHCGENHLHSHCRRKQSAPVVIPIGYCCPTAEFIKMTGMRRLATPLDWCKATLPAWVHILGDSGKCLAHPSQVMVEPDASKPWHKLYSEEHFPRTQLWVHGHDADVWARRCERLHELLHDTGEQSQVLGLHIDFENSEDGAGGIDRLDAFALDATALGAAADCLAGASMHVVAILFVRCGGASAKQADVATIATERRLPLEPTSTGTGFTVARPRDNVTIVRYVVPHDTRNGAGNPLPKGQNALLADDAANLHDLLQGLFPERFSSRGAADSESTHATS